MEWLREIRKENGMTQEEAAEKTDIKRASYSNIENGKRRPSVEAAKRIAGLFGFDWTRFFDGQMNA